MQETCKFMLAGAWLCAASAIVALFSSPIWPFELTSHFKVQYSIILLISIVLYFPVLTRFTSRPRVRLGEFCTFLLAFLLSSFQVIQLYLPSDMRADKSVQNQRQMKFLQINVNAENDSYEKVSNYIKQESPDVVSFEEFTPSWDKRMNEALSEYPFRIEEQREGCFGMAVYSKIPFTSPPKTIRTNFNLPRLLVSFDLDGKPLHALFLHTFPPISPAATLERDNEMLDCIKDRKSVAGSFIMAGDMNCTPWSKIFQKLCNQADLLDSQQSFGVQQSWPVQSALLRIPIDHFLISADLQVVDRHIGPNIGSDHFPVSIVIQRKN